MLLGCHKHYNDFFVPYFWDVDLASTSIVLLNKPIVGFMKRWGPTNIPVADLFGQ
jgi:hypothetical protein